MPSRTIRPTEAPAAAPFAYVLGATENFAPEAITASWDGAHAFGPFLPCVSFYSPDGVLIGRAFPDAPVAAGDSAEVSYFPFRRGGGGGSPLLVDDNSVVVFPTTNLFFNSGATVTNAGPGIAQVDIATTPVPTYVRVHMTNATQINPTGSAATPDSEIPLTVIDNDGFGVTQLAHGKVLFPSLGLYAIYVMGPDMLLQSSHALQLVADTGASAMLWTFPALNNLAGTVAPVWLTGTLRCTALGNVLGGYVQFRFYNAPVATCSLQSHFAANATPDFAVVRLRD